MEFTEANAKEKERKWVRTRDNSFLSSDGVPEGTRGQVVCHQLLGTVEVATKEEVWVVNVRFYPSHDKSQIILVENMGKEQYERSLEELEVDKP